jgi:propanol-preferring alcohol dehydrogenase
MKVWVLDEAPGALREAEVPIPTPGEGQVLVKVRASGLCHSDVGFMDGVVPTHVPLPLILGHEASGTIVAVGSGFTGWNVGDAVVSAIAEDDCPGFTRDGAYAECVILTADKLVRIPAGLDWAQAAAATDAGLTSYTGVVVFGEVKAGDRVGIVGLGGLGMIGARIAVLQGATVYGVEPREAVWDDARATGLTEVFADVSALQGLDLDVIIDFAGFGTTTAGAIRAVKTRGRVVLIGVGVAEWTISSVDLVRRSVELRGATLAGDAAHLHEVLNMFATGELAIRAEAIGFSDIPEGLGRLQRGEVNGRLVAVFD